MSDLVVKNLSVTYSGVRAVRDFSCTVAAGKLLALLGPNGSGKSSIARAVMGLVPAEGSVSAGGQPLLGTPVHRRAAAGIAFVPEGRGIIAPLTVEENILLGGYTLGAALRRRRLDEVCGLFPILAERLGQQSSSLSGGEQQMLAVARALMTKPRILICDEPSMGLAPTISKLLFRTLRRIADDGAAVLVGDQNAGLLVPVADAACVVRLGRLVATVDPKDFESPAALAEHYFGAETGAMAPKPMEGIGH